MTAPLPHPSGRDQGQDHVDSNTRSIVSSRSRRPISLRGKRCRIHRGAYGQEPGEVKFEQVADVAPCVTAAVLNGDPSKGASTLVMKASSGCKIPWHWHSSTEEVVMTAGVGRVQMKDGKPSTVRAGTYAMVPAHHVHQFTCTASCTLFLHSDGVFDTHYVNAAGAEIPASEALKTTTPAKK